VPFQCIHIEKNMLPEYTNTNTLDAKKILLNILSSLCHYIISLPHCKCLMYIFSIFSLQEHLTAFFVLGTSFVMNNKMLRNGFIIISNFSTEDQMLSLKLPHFPPLYVVVLGLSPNVQSHHTACIQRCVGHISCYFQKVETGILS